MSELVIWFLDVGHGDCTYIQMPNEARMMIDCGCGDSHWPSKMLMHYKISRGQNPIPIDDGHNKYALDELIISHPHGDHLGDIEEVHKRIGFYMLAGGYSDFIDDIAIEKIDFRKRGQQAAKKFIEIVKEYTGTYDVTKR